MGAPTLSPPIMTIALLMGTAGACTSTPLDTATIAPNNLASGLVEGLLRFRRGRRLEPVISLGAGILYLSGEGHEMAPYIGGHAWRISAAADAGVGLRTSLRPRRVELGVEVHALVAEPYPIVRFFHTEVARAGRPSLLASVTLLGGI